MANGSAWVKNTAIELRYVELRYGNADGNTSFDGVTFKDGVCFNT